MKSDHRSNFSNLGNWKEKALKITESQTRDFCATGAMLHQLWAMKRHIEEHLINKVFLLMITTSSPLAW